MMGTTSGPAQYLVKLRRRTEVAERTTAFAFEKPANFVFKAGQFLEFTLTSPPETDSEGDSRAFSIASAPHEEMLMVATRMRDTAFKRVLGSMPLESQVKVEGPFGDLVLHNNQARAAVFLAGGIGITPFRSMVVRAAKEQSPRHLFLFYSNRRPEDAAFLEELKGVELGNPNFKFVGTMTEMAKSRRSWDGETGLLDFKMLSRYLKGAASPIYYIAGPPAMVTALREMLNHAGVDDDDIRMEEFAGY
jgi:ferredoxin-NADP reductase